MSDSEEDTFAANLGAEECDRLCNKFAEITSTDSVVAMMFLQRNMWNLEGAIETYYNQFVLGDDRPLSARLTEKQEKPPKKKLRTSDEIASTSTASESSSRPQSALSGTKRVKILSWNTDGIDESEPKARAACTSDVILKENPDVFFLQEVTETTLAIFEKKLGDRYEISNGDFGPSYFTAIGAKKETVSVESTSFEPFGMTQMGRGLQTVEAKLYGVPVTLITSHLESSKDYTEQRTKQFRKMLKEARDADISRVVLVGGDLNLREAEFTQAGGLPRGFYDAWEAAGKRDVARYTYDISRNDNHGEPFPGAKFKARCRFDRLYYRSADDATLKPVYFELVGLQRSTPLRRFPSDHWGILFHADLSSA